MSTYLARIRDIFEEQGFEESKDPPPHITGERRSLVERYYSGIDWTSASECERLLRVYESALDDLAGRAAMTYDSDVERAALGTRDRLLDLLARDGIERDGHGRLRPLWDSLGSPAIEQLPSESAVVRDLERMRNAVDTDPDIAVGAAKDAVESILKYGLHLLGESLTGKEKLQDLAGQLHRGLGLHPEAFGPDTKGANAIKKVLSSLINEVQALAEIRNLYGVGKGRVTRSGLRPRHARLAAKTADAYVTFILDTLNAEDAPWRKGTPATSFSPASSSG